MKPVTLALALCTLSGCATQSTYNWGGYEDALYASYKDVAKTEALKLKLEAHVSSMEAAKQKVAPGLYAELGTLHLQAGSKTKAMELYAKERATWPESSQLMTALIDNIRRTEQSEGQRK